MVNKVVSDLLHFDLDGRPHRLRVFDGGLLGRIRHELYTTEREADIAKSLRDRANSVDRRGERGFQALHGAFGLACVSRDLDIYI